MADNIKIVGNILNTTTVSRYSSEDTNLISSRILQENFGETGDYIEVYLYDIGNNLLSTNYNYLSYKLPSDATLKPGTNTQPNTTGNIQTTNIGVVSTLSNPISSLYPIIEIDPVMDIQNEGYSSGEFIIKYNLFKNKISNSTDQALFIKEISADRTEIRLASTTLINDEIESVVNSIIDEINNSDYYVDYLLNFGDNEQYVAVNVALNKATTGYEILFKLYQPLPLSVQEKTQLWVVEEKVNPYIFDINLDKLITPPPPPTLRGPNFDIPIENQGTIATAYGTYSNLISSLQNKSYYQVLNLMATQSADINVDYTDFNNFVFFGSAKQRVINFHVKAKQIEDYNTLISTYTPQTSSIPSLITEINQYTSNIKDITTQFDGYEYYLYFESSSYAWPKSGSLKPYILLSTTNSTVTAWYNNLILVAEDYDQNNYDNLEFAIPPFLTEDDTNAPFLLFLNMIGNYFDDIWVYIKSITDLNLANNNLDYGISKDLVYERLKSLGIKLYNSQAGESVSQYLIGANTGSSIFDNNFTITGSYLNNIPRKDLTSELYKRIYHNLPLLVKTKGTVAGLEHLNTIFGITSSILNVKEFGGSTKAGLINGYNNDKVRIVQNTITGSVLSSMLSLQTFPTASSAFRDNDMHYVDISFSPQAQIDTYISESISVNNPTWSLDDYIGDPRQQYNNSYSDLNNQRISYYQTGNTGSLSLNSGSVFFAEDASQIQVTSNNGIKFGTSDYTIETWVYFNTSNTSSILGEDSTNISDGGLSFYKQNNSLFIDQFDSQVTYGYSFPSITLGEWHHVAISRSGSKETAWLDGVRSTSGIQTNNTNFSGWTNFIGNIPDYGLELNGYLTNLKAIKGSYLYNPASSSISVPTTPFTNTIINSTTWQLPLINDNYIPYYTAEDIDISTLNPFTQAYPGFTSSLLDYNGFIRLIDYFDNSLFKMLADFTPERTSLSTGVTINSPVLERNKTSFANPTTSNTQSVHTAQFNTASITPQYSPLYNNLTGDKKPYFTGELSGSVVDVHQYFTDNYNQYLGDWDVYNSQHTISQSINLNSFNHSDWNVLLNNVSKNVTSNKRKGIEYIYGTTGSITSSVELQDSNLSLRSYQISRYEGSKVTSAIYNTYTSASSTYIGDKSYGKRAAIDLQSLKVAWVKNIPSQSLNFYDKTTIDLKYLVDSSTSLIELSLANTNLCEVQNTFKSGTPVLLSISDVQKPSNQTNLNGLKTIFRGGYSYDPLLYREANETLTFTHDNIVSSTSAYLGIKAYNLDSYRWLAGDCCNSIKIDPNKPATQKGNGGNGVNGDSLYWINNVLTPLDNNILSYNKIGKSLWNHQNNINIDATNHKYPSTFDGKRSTANGYTYAFNVLNFSNTTTSTAYNNEPNPDSYSNTYNNYLYKVPRTSTYHLSGSIPFWFRYNDDGKNIGDGPIQFKIMGIVQKSINPNDELSWIPIATTYINPIKINGNVIYNKNYNAIRYDNTDTIGNLFDCVLNEDNISLEENYYIRFQFYLLDSNENLFYSTSLFSFNINGVPPEFNGFKLPSAFFEIYDKVTTFTKYNYTSTYSQIPPLFITASSNSIVFNSTAQSLINSDAIFTPSAPASNYYSPVVDYFGIQKQDLLRVGQFNNLNPIYYEILNTYTSSGQTYATLDRTIDTGSFNNAQSFAILRPKPNETSIIINYRKQLGDVSQTILIPYDANDIIKNNVGNIFKTLNTSLQ